MTIGKFLFLVFALSLNLLVTAQQNWLKTAGAVADEELLDACVDANGDIVYAGYFTGPVIIGTTSLLSSGNTDILVIKTDNAGNITWVTKAGGSGPDRATS